MGSTVPTKSELGGRQAAGPQVLRWRNWPLAQGSWGAWAIVLGIAAAGIGVGLASASAWLGVAAGGALAVTLWQFLLPADYEVNPVGFSRQVVGFRRLVPWQAVRSFQPRAAGIVLFQCDDPAPIDALRSEFLPYSSDEDETLCAVRQYLRHASELPG
jgi:hypothetical protein